METNRSLLVIADIGGYTRFLKLHTVSMVHAQHVVGRLLEAVIGSVRQELSLAKLEGDAAFFHAATGLEGADVSRLASTMHAAFHHMRADLSRNALCPCDGCQQAGELRIKVVAHVGDVTRHRVARRQELPGLDVILVHRLLKNEVPLAEYLLVTAPLLPALPPAQRASAQALAMDVEGIGRTDAWFVELTAPTGESAYASTLPLHRRFARQLHLAWQTLPFLFGRHKACADFRNVTAARD